ncbi:hypothetical protein FACS1894159_02840 [Bacteroidia bacterium]|nr:hypothetical protein FACS1894159_02840 [Bacteroidia bacterium]
MLSVSPEIYRAVADRLLRAIADKEFFNGSIEYDTEEFYSSLRTTLIIYRDKSSLHGGGEPISDIVPVWWEFSLSQPQGEVDTDFSWRELKEYLI